MTETKTTTKIAIPKELHQRLLAAAEERLVSPDFLVKRAIENLLDNLPPVDPTENPFKPLIDLFTNRSIDQIIESFKKR